MFVYMCKRNCFDKRIVAAVLIIDISQSLIDNNYKFKCFKIVRSCRLVFTISCSNNRFPGKLKILKLKFIS